MFQIDTDPSTITDRSNSPLHNQNLYFSVMSPPDSDKKTQQSTGYSSRFLRLGFDHCNSCSRKIMRNYADFPLNRLGPLIATAAFAKHFGPSFAAMLSRLEDLL